MSTKLSLERMKTSPLFHWTAVATGKVDPSKAPLHTKVLGITATSIDEVSVISLAADLIQGKGPKELQKKFDSTRAKNLKDFQSKFPDFKYSIGGRKRGEPVEA